MGEIKGCLHCGGDEPNYCEKCFQKLIGENAKLQEEIAKKDRQLEEKTNRVKNIEKECQKYFDNMMNTIQENNKKNMIINLMAEELTTPIHSKEWVINFYKKRVEG